MPILLHGRPRPAPGDALLQRLGSFHQLDQALQWALAQRPAPEVDVLAQDEYSHDVWVGLGPTLWVVFDTT